MELTFQNRSNTIFNILNCLKGGTIKIEYWYSHKLRRVTIIFGNVDI